MAAGPDRAKVTGDANETVIAGSQTSHDTELAPKSPKGRAERAEKTTRLGDFVVQKKLGQGGMGAVYLAQQVSLDRPVALKLLSKELAAKPGFVERFVREARSMAKINHPHVVSCYHVGEDKGLHFVAMELMDGKSMQDWLNQLGQIPVPDAVLVAIICAEALDHAHSLNMVHRDVKPDNILVTARGIVKVSDLGLAKALDDQEMSMTQSGTGLGTPHYMPPEQARNAKYVNSTCDIYALGSTLYHFVTGRTPFAGESIIELISNKEKSNCKPARQWNKDVSERLSLIIDKAMAKDPKARYATCREFIRDLESLKVAAESLSFITGEAVVQRRGAANAPSMPGRATRLPANAPTAPPGAIPSSPPAPEAPRRTAGSDGIWYVKQPGSDGTVKVNKMTTSQVLQMMRSDRFDIRAQAAVSSTSPFLPLSQIPVFVDEAHKLVTRQTVKKRENSLAAEYDRIDRQLKRQKWWRILGRFRDGTLGLVGLFVYLAAIGAAIAGLVIAYPYAADYVSTHFLKN